MGESRHRTVVEVGVDDRQVRGVGQTIERSFDPKIIDAFNRSLDRTARSLEKITSQQGRLVHLMARMEQQQRQRGGGGGGGGGGGRGGGAGDVALGTMIGNALPRAVQSPFAMIGAASQGQGLSQMLSSFPLIGQALGGAVTGIMSFYQSFLQRETARARSFGGTGVRQLGEFGRSATSFGLMPGEQFGALQQFGASTGQRGSNLSAIAPRLLEYQQLLGFNQLGGVTAGATAAGGTERGTDTLEAAVSAGIAAGFSEGQLDRFFGQFGAWLDQTRTEGIDLTASSALNLVGAVSRLGPSFQGEAGSRAAMSIQQALKGSGMRSGPLAMLMLQAQGVGEPGGPSSIQAEADIAANPQAALERARPLITARLGGGGSADGFAISLRNFGEQMGIQMSAQEWIDTARRWQSGQPIHHHRGAP